MVASPRTSLALALAGLITITLPRHALAAPAAGEAEPEPSTTELAESKFRAGQTKYETADYDGAIELWTEAYGLVESTPETAAIKALLIFNLAQAHVKAFELHEDTLHLKKARALLDSYRASLELLYADEAARADESAKVDATLADIAAKLDAAERDQAEAEPTPGPTAPPPQVDAPPSNPSPGNPLLFAGVGVTVLGVAMGGVGLGLGAAWAASANDVSGLEPSDLDAREQQFTRGRRANSLMIAGGVIAGVLIPTGVALLAIGAKRNADARRSRQARVPQLVPSFGPQGGGLVLTGRF
jgi:hypothetical protein